MFDTSPQLDCAGRIVKLDRPRVMGIVNVTPDSFSDGGAHATADAAVAHGLR
jgi:dihydropteroate synthase